MGLSIVPVFREPSDERDLEARLSADRAARGAGMPIPAPAMSREVNQEGPSWFGERGGMRMPSVPQLVDPEKPSGYGLTRFLFPNRDPARIEQDLRDRANPPQAPIEGQTRPQPRPDAPPEVQAPIEGQTRPRPRGQGEAPEARPANPRRDGRPLSFGAFAPVAQAVGQTAPATGAAIAETAQAMSVQNAPGQQPSQAQYRRMADDMVDRFVNEWGPKEFMHLMEQGRLAEAFAWRDFYESKEAREQANHFSRAVFAVSMGDANTAIREATAAVAGSEIGDMYEVIPEKSGFLGENDDLFARFTFRNRQTGDEFTQSFATMEELVGGLASIASAESAFERKQAGIQQRIDSIMQQQAADEDKIIRLAKMFYKNFDDILGASTGQGITEEERRKAAHELARLTIADARSTAQAGVGSLGFSQGGTRNPNVPSVGAP